MNKKLIRVLSYLNGIANVLLAVSGMITAIYNVYALLQKKEENEA